MAEVEERLTALESRLRAFRYFLVRMVNQEDADVALRYISREAGRLGHTMDMLDRWADDIDAQLTALEARAA